MHNFKTLLRLLTFARPMTGWMCLAVLLGIAGFVSAAAIPVLAVYGITMSADWTALFWAMAGCALARGILRYGEQACNHYIAFKLLAHIRDLIFGKLRTLAPARLDGHKKGDMIALITNDVELLEVFFAHTISPVCIAAGFTLLALAFAWSFHPLYAGVFAIFYAFAGIGIPALTASPAVQAGTAYRKEAGRLQALVLETVRGMKACVQFGKTQERLDKTEQRAASLSVLERQLKLKQSEVTGWLSLTILSGGAALLWAGSSLLQKGQTTPADILLMLVFLLSSFGPVTALANLSTGLAQTLGAGKRVLALLEERPVTCEVKEGAAVQAGVVEADNLGFSYPDGGMVLDGFDFSARPGQMIGIAGKSGCGKSTFLKLLMRFYDPAKGGIRIQEKDLRGIRTDSLQAHQSFVSQETVLFARSVKDNLRVAKRDASMEEMEAACRKARLHQRILELPHGYDTVLQEEGSSLSAGERQRLSLARAFLHDGKMLLLDEPTSNLDVLNEGALLEALDKERKEKLVVLVSHRQKSLDFADGMIFMNGGKRDEICTGQA